MVLGSPKVTWGGAAQGFCCFCIKIGKLEAPFFLQETCEPLIVRGTTSFYNNKLQILHVGEGAMWNFRM